MKLGNNERATRETGQASGPAAPAVTPLERVRALAPAIAAAAEEGERLRRLPDSLMAALHDAGLFRLLIPRRFGGEELDPVSFIEVIGAVGAIDASTAWCLCQNAVCGLTAGYLTPEVATKIFGDRRAVLAWGPGPQARAVPVEGGYRISGTWSFASGGRHATWLGAYCPLYQADGTPLHDIGGALLGRTMLFPASEARMVDIWNVIGLRATGSDGYTLENHFVPSAHSFQRDDPAERVEKGPLYLFPTNTMFAGGFACLALGIAGAVLDAFLALAREKTPRGFKHRLAENGTVQGRIAQALGQLRSSRVYILDCFEEAWREARETGALSLERRMAVRLASTHSIQQAKAVVDTAYDLAGATAIFTSSPFERRFRDMHTVAQQVQGRFSHFETVGKFMLGLEPELAFL